MAFIGNPPIDKLLTSGDITDGTIVSSKLADSAVITAKIADGTVTAEKLDTSAVAKGGGIFYENNQLVTADYTITINKNAMSAGPIEINTGVTVTVPSGSTWTIV